MLSALTKDLAVGTNLGLLQFLWMLVSGALLAQRGGLFPALKAVGLTDSGSRRAWAAFRGGGYSIGELLRLWQIQVEGLAGWQVHRHEGYVAVPIDVTAFWRPRLKDCPSKHFHPQANKALPAVIIGLVGEVGDINGQRLARPRAIERVTDSDGREQRLWQRLLRKTRQRLAADEIVVLDAGVKLKDVHAAELERYVLRLPTNFTARRNQQAPACGKGRPPEYGGLIRPLPRARKGQTIAGSVPDYVETWVEDGRTIRADIWEDLVRPNVKPHLANSTFRVYALHDPAFDTPWLLATPLPLHAITVKAIFRDRWPIEQLPLAAKQMLGAHRQFVHTPETIQRLPELALLAGSILSFLAASAPPTPTGFWDRHPKRTPGRFRRLLMGQPFPDNYPLPGQLRQKRSVTAHLPKGILAVRSKKTATHASVLRL